MSTALASARRRRAGPEAVAPAPGVRQTVPQPSFPGSQQPQLSSQNMGPALTLPQVISLVDKRLLLLESFVQSQSQSAKETGKFNYETNDISATLEEYGARFDIIADELATLKETVMKLQTYTMEVNKMLMEDRIRILSDDSTPLERALN